MILSDFVLHFYILQTDISTMIFQPTILIILIVIVGSGFYLLNKNKESSVNLIVNQAQNLKNKAGDLSEAAMEKVDSILDEYQKILPYMEELGLTVDGLSIEAGLLPKIKTSLIASIDNIETEAVERIKKENSQNQLLTSILNAVLLAKKLDKRLDNASITLFKELIIDITLGVPPSIAINFK